MPLSASLPLLARAETHWDRLRREVKGRFGWPGQPIVHSYRGFGTARSFSVSGRVLDDPGVGEADLGDSSLTNALRMFRRYESDEIPGALVRCRFAGREIEAVSDEEGYFTAEFDLGPDAPSEVPRWREVEIELKAPAAEATWTAPVLTPPPDAAFGLISDIDDTIVRTGAFNWLKHWRSVVTTNASTRVVFPGVPAFYRALEWGRAEAPTNPVFYVSSSPWNIYDLFEQFMALNRIPPGPMLLRDFGLDETKLFTGTHGSHKTAAIERIMAQYPHMTFILIGDSGQRDAAIYADIVARHPGRILAVFIHDVVEHGASAEVRGHVEDIARAGVVTALGPDLLDAADAALARGWITEAAHAGVVRDVSGHPDTQ